MAQTPENMAGGPKTDLIFIPADQHFPLSLFPQETRKQASNHTTHRIGAAKQHRFLGVHCPQSKFPDAVSDGTKLLSHLWILLLTCPPGPRSYMEAYFV